VVGPAGTVFQIAARHGEQVWPTILHGFCREGMEVKHQMTLTEDDGVPPLKLGE